MSTMTDIQSWYAANPNANAQQQFAQAQGAGWNMQQIADAMGTNVNALAGSAINQGLNTQQLMSVGFDPVAFWGQHPASQTGTLSSDYIQNWAQQQGMTNLSDPRQSSALFQLAQQWGVDPTTLSNAYNVSLPQLNASLEKGGVSPGQLYGYEGSQYVDPMVASNPYMGQLQNLMTNPQSALQSDPGYQFRLQQGEQALARSGAAKGFVGSGNMATALTDYAQGLASQEYGNALQHAESAAGLYTGVQNTGFTQGLQAQELGLQTQNQAFGQGMAQQEFGLQSQAQAFGQNLSTQELNMGMNQQQFNMMLQSAGMYDQLYNSDFMRTLAGSNALSADESTYLQALTQLSGGKVDPSNAAKLYAEIMGQGGQATGQSGGNILSNLGGLVNLGSGILNSFGF